MAEALLQMAKKPIGRPKGAGRITTRHTIVVTPEFQTWFEQFMGETGDLEISEVYRAAIRCYAESKGFRQPPRR